MSIDIEVAIGGFNVKRSSLIQKAARSPAAPPIKDSSALSVSNCRTSRARLAPSARRTAISFLRVSALASSRLATLKQATNNTFQQRREIACLNNSQLSSFGSLGWWKRRCHLTIKHSHSCLRLFERH